MSMAILTVGWKKSAKMRRAPLRLRSIAVSYTHLKPRFNGYACGHGAHGDAKYNRAKEKRAWRERGGQEGASRGSFPFLVAD